MLCYQKILLINYIYNSNVVSKFHSIPIYRTVLVAIYLHLRCCLVLGLNAKCLTGSGSISSLGLVAVMAQIKKNKQSV